MLIVFQRGISRVPNSIVSTTRRIEGSGGKRNSFCAMYSFRMSFWSVPPSLARAMPRFSAAAMYIAQNHGGRAVDGHGGRDLVQRDAVEEDLHVGQGGDRYAALAELAHGLGRVGVVAVKRRHIEGDRKAGLPLAQQVLEARRWSPRRVPKPANMRIVHSLPR